MLKQEKIKIREKDYLVSFPNVEQLMEIESFKLVYTKNKYVQLSMSDLNNHAFLLDLTDTISYLGTLIPELKEDLGVKSWWELDPFVGKELIKVYRKQFVPWFLPILQDLYSYDEEDAGKKV